MRDGPRKFLLRRIARIGPLYWAVTAAIILYIYAVHGAKLWEIYSPASLVASFLFWPYPRIDGFAFPVHLLGWTLNFEMFFYAVFAAAIVLPRRAAVAAVCVALAALVTLGRHAALPLPFQFWANPIVLEFCLGMLIAAAYREGVRLPPAGAWALGIAACLALAAMRDPASGVGRVAPPVLGPAERRAGRVLRAVGEHVASGTGRALLRAARRCVVFALSRAPAGVPAGALDRRALDRFFGNAVGLCGRSRSRGDRGVGRLLLGVRAADHARAATAAARGARDRLRGEDQRRQDEQRAERKPGQFRQRARQQRKQKDRRARDLRCGLPFGVECASHTTTNAPSTRS